jgi:hypothetical protein
VVVVVVVVVVGLCSEWAMQGMHRKVKGNLQKTSVQYGKE